MAFSEKGEDGVIDRRTVIAGGLALGAARGLAARPSSTAKRQAIEAIRLPPGFNGVLAHGAGGKVDHLRCVGMADLERGIPITRHTRFKWGSASKWLASVTMLRLVEQGRLSIDAPITTYLPEFRRDTGARVLVRHLLSNTSGITDLLVPAIKADPSLRDSSASPAAILARFGDGDLRFVPGSGWDYAALNWVIVAAILERVTGTPLAAAVQRMVLRPLGMDETGYVQLDQRPMPAVAAAYASVAPPVRKMLPVPAFLAGSGNTASTVRDAMRGAHGIFHGSLLNDASREELTTIRWREQEYALGGRVHPIDGKPWAWETGKVEGYRAHIAHRLGKSETVVIFNTTDIAQSVIADWVETIARAGTAAPT